MTLIKNLIKVWDYKIYYGIEYNLLKNFVPKIWQVILTSDGSFTRNISIINNTPIKIELIKQQRICKDGNNINLTKTNRTNLNREVWLTHEKKKVVFAHSSWQIKNTIVYSFPKQIPIGKNLITSEINIHREIQSIYLCYSTQLEKYFQYHGPLWGRSYHICFDQGSVIIINEIFALNNQEFIPEKIT